MPPALPRIIIVTPFLADANNGNWRTAHRWQLLLADQFTVIVQGDWQGEECDALIALHARRSAPVIQRFRESRPHMPLIVVLTGTDLYRDLACAARLPQKNPYRLSIRKNPGAGSQAA
jgi:hypothetical protein